MKMIKASLVMDDQCDQHADGQPHRQTKDIDEGKNLVFKEISQRDFDVVSKHGRERVFWFTVPGSWFGMLIARNWEL
jgi:hypothetical protein